MTATNHINFPYKDQLSRWLIDPVTDRSDIPKEEIHLLSVTSLGLIVIGLIVVFVNIIFTDLDLLNKTMHIELLFAISGISLAYAGGRYGYYTVAVWLLISVCSVVIWTMGAVQESINAVHPFTFLLIPILITGLLHSPVIMIMVASINIIAILLIPSMSTLITHHEVLTVAIELVILTGFIFFPLILLKERIIAFETMDHTPELPFHNMIDSLPDMVAIHVHGKYVYINSAGLRLFKANSIDDMLNKSTQQFLHPDYRHTIPAELVHLDQNRQLTFKTNEKYILLDGETLDVEVLTTQISYLGDLATQVVVKPLAQSQKLETLTTQLAGQTQEFAYTEQHYQHLLKTTSDIMITCDEQGQITLMNATGQNILGYSSQQLETRRIDSLVAPMRLQEFNDYYQRHTTQPNDTAYLETEFMTQSGQIIPFEVNLSTITLPNNQSEQVFLLRDLTEQQVAQMVIQQSEDRFANIFENTLVGISIISFDKGIILDVNATFLSLFGYTRNDLLGSPVTDHNFWSVEEYQANQHLLLTQGYLQQVHHSVPNKNGDLLRIIRSLQLVNLGGESCILTFTQDYTEQYMIEQTLRTNENRYRAISELITDFAYSLTVDEKGIIHLDWITESFARMTGHSIESAYSWHHWKKMFHPDDFQLVIDRIKNLVKGEPTTLEVRLITKAGEIIWIRDHAHPIWDEKLGRVVSIIAATQNITEQYFAEVSLKTQALQQAIISEFGQLALKADTKPNTLFQEGVTLAAQILNVEYCEFLEYDTTNSALILRAGIGWEDELIGTVLLDANDPYVQVLSNTSNQTVKLPSTFSPKILEILEERQIVNGIGVVIQGQTHPIGILAVHTTQTHKFSRDDANFLQAIANVFSAYIEQQRIQETERNQRAFAEAISEIASILTSTLDLDTVLETLLTSLRGVVEHDTSSILIIEDGVAKVAKHYGFEKYNVSSQALSEIAFPVKTNKTIRDVIEKRQPIVRDNVHDDPNWVFTESTRWIRANIAVPIIFGNEVLGIVDVDSETIGAFTEKDAQRLSAFAHHASIAIRNARRTTELSEQVAERTADLDFERRKLESILDASGEGILLVEDDVIVYVNEALCVLTGYNEHQLIDQSVAHLLIEDEALPDWATIRSTLPAEHIGRHEHRIRCQDETYFDAALTVSLANHPETIDYTVVIIRDISQERELNAKQSRFIANAAHELRSPIASLNTRLYMLRNDIDNRERHIEMLARIVNRANNLVGKLLDLSRFANGVIVLNRQEVILQSLVKDVYEQLYPEATIKHFTFTYTAVDSPLRVFADPDRILQVVVILINNAMNYTPEKGEIAVTLTTVEYDDTLSKDSSMAVISVKDNGAGIDSENIDFIFQPFSRATNEHIGTGLGLSIAKEIMTLHEGDIRVTSTLGEGSIFSAYLPLLPTPIIDD